MMCNTIMDPAAATTIEFEDTLMRIGFGLPERMAIIEMSGCLNIAMLGLLTIDQVSKVCKCIEMHQVSLLLAITTLQEQLLLTLCFWVTNRQRLQLPILAADFTVVIALNQAQVMKQQYDARVDKDAVAKAPDKFKNAPILIMTDCQD
jgi:hypothetical protein